MLVVVLLIVLFTARASGDHLLKKWGLLDPSPEQVRTATRYLRYRRLLYAAGLVGGPAVLVGAGKLAGADPQLRNSWGLLASVLAALLVAELVAACRPVRDSTRSALLTRRRWSDLVPWSAVVVHLLLLVVAVLQSVAVLAAARSWTTPAHAALRAAGGQAEPPDTTLSWFALAGAVLGALAVYGVVGLAARRRADADDEVDPVLRTRTARVAVGTGIGLALGLLGGSNNAVAALWVYTFAPGAPPTPGYLHAAHAVDGIAMLIVVLIGLAEWYGVVRPPTPPRLRPARTRAAVSG